MNNSMDRQLHHQTVQRALELGRGADPAALSELAGLIGFPSSEGFVEFDFGVEVSAIEKHFVEASIAESALECLLAARVFVGGGFASATNAFMPGAFLFEPDGFADGLRGGMSRTADVILHALVGGKVVEVLEVVTGGGSVPFESLQRVLLCLRMRITQGNGSEGFHGGLGISAERRQLSDGGGGQTANSITAKAGTLVQSDGERLIADWLMGHNIAYRYDERFRILSGHAARPDFYLPELDVYIEYWGMDTADYKIGMLKKQQLYQQEGKRFISIYPADKPRLDRVLRAKLALFGHHLPPPGTPGVGEP
jgi:hypothetical protein